MNHVAKVLLKIAALLCYIHVGKNVRVNCRVEVKLKDVKVDGKEVKEAKASDVVNNIMRAWMMWLNLLQRIHIQV